MIELAAAALLALPLLAQSVAPVVARVVPDADITYMVSGSLPPGAEFHLVYEDPQTHAVQLLVRFPSGYELPGHSHSHDETIVVRKGKLQVTLDGKDVVLGPGGYAVFPAGTTHALKSKGKCELFVAVNGPYDVKGLPSVK